MKTFDEYQAEVTKVPISLRNNRDRIDMPVMGLQQEAGKIGRAMEKALQSGTFILSQVQKDELKDGLADILWCVAMLCKESGLSIDEIARHSAEQVAKRTQGMDPDQR